MPKRKLLGVVKSDKASMTRRIEIPRQLRHRKYGKIIRRRTVCYAHDEGNVSASGDLVEIEESRPLSRLKRWVVTRVVLKCGQVDQAAIKAAHQGLVDEGVEGAGENS